MKIKRVMYDLSICIFLKILHANFFVTIFFLSFFLLNFDLSQIGRECLNYVLNAMRKNSNL